MRKSTRVMNIKIRQQQKSKYNVLTIKIKLYLATMSIVTSFHKFCVICRSNLRLDVFLAQLFPDFSRSNISSWIKEGKVRVNDDVVTKTRIKVNYQDIVELNTTDLLQSHSWEKQEINLDILFEDEQIIILNKPCGLTVHPGAGQSHGTLANALHFYNEDLNNLPRMGIVHRLDKDTSGIMVIAKTLKAHNSLVKQLQDRTIIKTYSALVIGNLISGDSIVTDIGRDPKRRTAMAVVHQGKEAITHFRIKQRFRQHSLLEVKIETGRTHQIRVHMAYIKHPIVADKLYNKNGILGKTPEKLKKALQDFSHQALHALSLEFKHPESNKSLFFSCPYPEDFEQLLQILASEDNKWEQK